MSGRRSSRLSNAPAIIRTTIRARARRSSMVLRRAPWPRCRSRSRTASWRWRNRSPAASALFRAESGLARERRGGNVMTNVLMRSVCVAAIAAAGMCGASAQQMIEPASATPVPGPMPEILRKYTPVTAERLKNPEDGNWLMFRRTFDGWGYSPLGEITPANVTPLHPTSRGVGLYGDKVYFAAAEAVLVAIDARTGKEAWAAKVDDYKKGYYLSLAPLVIDGKVLLGASGGELGARGFLAAFDAETGKELWKTYTVPAPGEPGSETWPAGGDHYKRGGASIWITGTYDPETNLTFWGTGNGGPWFGDQRPGDNLFTSSVVAFNPGTGQIKGHFQYHPNDSWDWDEVSPPLIVDYRRDGRTVKGLVNVARDGYLWQLERTRDKINFVAGQPYVRQNVFKGLDPGTGRPDVDETRKPGTGKAAEFCPSLWGGKNWPPAAYSPQTRMLYIPANDNLCTQLTGEPPKYVQGERF